MNDFIDYSLDSNSSVPKYEQLRLALLDYISKQPADSEYLPFEHEIETWFGVSKKTVRRALEELRNAGIIKTTRKRGSQIIKRDFKILSSSESVGNLIKGTTVAVVVMTRIDSPDQTKSVSWQVMTEFDDVIGGQGGSVVVYNVYDKQWNSVKVIVDSMKERGIEWAFLHLDSCPNVEELVNAMLEAEIKPVLFAIDFMAQQKRATLFIPGLDYIVVNNLSAIRKTIMEQFADSDLIVYLTAEPDLIWSAPRAETCEATANEMNIPFKQVIVPIETPLDRSKSEYLRVRMAAAQNGVEHVISLIDGKERPVCIAANDYFAAGALNSFEQFGWSVPERVKLLGYDNLEDYRSLNISTFDFGPANIAKALISLYKDFLSNKNMSMQTSTGKMIQPRFIKRMTS